MIRTSALTRYLSIGLLVAVPASPPRAFAWGNTGHRLINRLAAANLPAGVPQFLRTPTALDEIEYLGPEPDRWRSTAEPELDAAQALEHFIDLEPADALGPLPQKRLDFEAKVFASNQRPEKIGLLPWQADEVWERLKSAMRDYRTLQATHGNTQPVEAAILFYAGWLGHYAADGAQPLHTTIQYNGWTGPNPNGYDTGHKIHTLFESTFVDAIALKPADVQAKMTAAHAIEGDMFPAFIAYLRNSYKNVEKLYQIDKDGGFNGTGTTESRTFVTERVAAAASMLRDMIYTAWIDSAQPVPAYHPAAN